MLSAGLALREIAPGEIAAVDDQAADRGAVAAEILGRRIDDDRRAVVERPREQRRGGVVDDQRNAERPADRRHFGDREHGQLRIRQRLGVIGAGPRVGGAAEVLGVGGVDEADFDALVLQRVGEQVPGAAVEVGRRDDVVAGARDVLDRQGARRLAARHRQRRDAALERRDALLQHVVGRVHDARVDVAEFLEPEQVGGVVGALELVRRRLIDRHRDRARAGIGAPSGVESEGFRLLRRLRHDRLRQLDATRSPSRGMKGRRPQ